MSENIHESEKKSDYYLDHPGVFSYISEHLTFSMRSVNAERTSGSSGSLFLRIK